MSSSSSSDHTDQFISDARLALSITLESAVLFQIAAAVFLPYVLFNTIRSHLRSQTLRGRQLSHLMEAPTDYYFLNLLVIDVIQGLCSALHIKWIGQGHFDLGSSYCRAQGFFKQFGDLGVALTMLVIAAHTFALVFLKREVPNTKWFPLSVIGVIWLFLIFCTAIPAMTLEDYYYPTTYLCSTNPEYDSLHYGLEYYTLGIIVISGLALSVPMLRRLYSTDRNYPEHRRQQFSVYPIACWIVFTRTLLARTIVFSQSLSHVLVPSISFVSIAAMGFAVSSFIDGLVYVITLPFILCSMLSTFRSNRRGNSTAGAGRRNSGADGGQTGGAMSTMPKVTVTDGSEVKGGAYPDLEFGFRGGGHDQVMEMQQVKTTAL